MKKYLFFATAFIFSYATNAQLTVAPNGGNKKAFVSERIGLTDVSITYDRPHVNGREGKIWGQLIHEGYTDLGFGTSKAAPWRAGASGRPPAVPPGIRRGRALPRGGRAPPGCRGLDQF